MNKLNNEDNFGVDLIDQSNQTPRIPKPVKNSINGPSNDEIHIDKRDYDLSSAAHPLCCIFTFLFKAAAFIVYFFLGYIFSLVTTFIVATILGAIDFWVVKNITGRLLVGLRWWSDFDERGKQIWRFQSYDKEHKANSVDAAFFWTAQLAGTATWAVFFVIKVLSLNFFWTLLVFINLCLCGTNLYGYYKCRGCKSYLIEEHNKKLQQLRNQGIATIAGRLFGVIKNNIVKN